MKNMNRKLRRLTAKWLELPPDIALEMPRITITGPYEIKIENHNGVIHGSEELIKLSIPLGTLEIHGESLYIKSIMPEVVKVEGVVLAVKFVE